SRDEGDFAAEQPESAVDIAREDAEKIVDDPHPAHAHRSPSTAGAAGAGERPRKRSRDSAHAERHSAPLVAASPSRWHRRSVRRRGSTSGWSSGADLTRAGSSSRVISITVAVTAMAMNMIAPIWASTFPSMGPLPGSVTAVEHLRVARLVA